MYLGRDVGPPRIHLEPVAPACTAVQPGPVFIGHCSFRHPHGTAQRWSCRDMHNCFTHSSCHKPLSSSAILSPWCYSPADSNTRVLLMDLLIRKLWDVTQNSPQKFSSDPWAVITAYNSTCHTKIHNQFSFNSPEILHDKINQMRMNEWSIIQK